MTLQVREHLLEHLDPLRVVFPNFLEVVLHEHPAPLNRVLDSLEALAKPLRPRVFDGSLEAGLPEISYYFLGGCRYILGTED